MAGRKQRAKRRRVADIVALVGGIWPFAFALWSPGLAAPDSIEGLVRLHMLWWAGAAAAGALAR